MTRTVRWLLGGAGLALLALLAWWLLGDAARRSPWQAAAWLPKDAEVQVWTAPLGEVSSGARALAGRVQGLGGVVDAVKLASGVDFSDAEAVERAGLRADAGVALTLWQGAVWTAMPVTGQAGVDHLLEQLRRRGYGVSAAEGDAHGRHWAVADRLGQRQDFLRVWYVDGAALLRLPLDPTPTQTADAALDAYLAAAKLTPAELGERPGSVHARWLLAGSGGHAAQAKSLGHAALGPVDLIFGGVIERTQTATLDVSADAAGVRATLRLEAGADKLKDMADYHVGFVPAGAELAVGDLLPDETPLLLRLRVNPALWSMLPGPVQNAVLPSTALQALHPALTGVDARQMLGDFDGQLAIGLLAVADSVPLDPAIWPRLDWHTALRPFVIASFKSDTAAKGWLDRLRSAVQASAQQGGGEQVLAHTQGSWGGFAASGPGAPWWLLQRGRALAWLAGQGTGDDLRRLAEGKFPTLDKAAALDSEKQLVAGTQHGDGLLVATPRLVRSLRRRGVPEYATGLIGAIASVAVTVELLNDALVVQAILRPSDGDAEASPDVHGAGEAP
ncbi:MAG: hypothetical protein HY902_00145 [Deltaproteobacteria bacterium]|nr:hypothetical protein [Deltaproteobacteria bacterium]